MITSRRSLITGLGALLAAPAIVRASSLMPIKTFDLGAGDYTMSYYWMGADGFWQYIEVTETWVAI